MLSCVQVRQMLATYTVVTTTAVALPSDLGNKHQHPQMKEKYFTEGSGSEPKSHSRCHMRNTVLVLFYSHSPVQAQTLQDVKSRLHGLLSLDLQPVRSRAL